MPPWVSLCPKHSLQVRNLLKICLRKKLACSQILQQRCFTRLNNGNIGMSIGLRNSDLNRIVTPTNIKDLGLKTDTITYEILQYKSTKEILDFVGKLPSADTQGYHIARIMAHLLKTHFSTKLDTIPWLQSNMHIAYIQLLLNKNLFAMMEDVTGHQNFPLLCDLLLQNVNNLEPDELTDCTLSLMYLGIDQTLPIIHKMLSACQSQITNFNMTSLATLCNIQRCLNGRDYILLPKILKRYEEILDDIHYSWTVDDALAHCLAVSLMQKFSSVRLIEKYLSKLEKLQKQQENLDDVECLSSMARTIQSLFLIGPQKVNHKARHLLEPAIKACFEKIHQFEPHNIAEIVPAFRKCNLYENDLAALFERRVLDIIEHKEESLNIRDVSNMLYALSRHSSERTCLLIDNILHRCLLTQPVDIVVLSNIAESISMRKVPEDVLKLVQRLIAEQAEKVVFYISRFKKIMCLVSKQRFLEFEHEQLFTEALLNALDHQQGISMFTVVPIAQFLVSNSVNAMPDKLLDKLLLAIPKWKEGELYLIACALNKMRGRQTRQIRQQIQKIESSLHQSILNRVENISSLGRLYQLTIGLVIQSRNRDQNLTDLLMHSYLHFTKNLTDVSMMKTARVFLGLRYYLPEVVEDIVDFVVKQSSNQTTSQLQDSKLSTCEISRDSLYSTSGLHRDKILIVLSLCSLLGYQPKQQDKLVELVLSIYDNLLNEQQYYLAVRTLWRLALIQTFPVRELTELFSLSFLQKLDHYMEDNPQHQKSMSKMIMYLNRAVLLECPQLNVPWFHEDYCKSLIKNKGGPDEDSIQTTFIQEVKDALIEVLNGEEYLMQSVYSPYYYSIDFECMLDEKDQPIPAEEAHLLGDNVQRVAVLCMDENMFCHNSKKTSGWSSMKIKHLQMMGYNVVMVPHYDWFSMGLTDWQAKVDYLQSRIYEEEAFDKEFTE